jgi:FtsP/CotA-like multicopper oxidase with cupredoxin domain
MLTGGSTDLTLAAQAGEVVRFFFTNTANTRIFNVAIPGARMKLVGGDSGRCEHEEWTDSELLAPSERAVVDVLFDTSGTFLIENRTPDRSYRLGSVIVTDAPGERSLHEFDTLHVNDDLATERARLDQERTRPPDKTLVFTASMPILYGSGDSTPAAWSYVCPMHPEVMSDEPGTCPRCGMRLVPAAPTTFVCPMHPDVTSSEPATCPKCGMKLVPSDTAATPTHDAHDPHHHDGDNSGDGLEWEDLMPEINAGTDASNMIWRLVDQETGAENTAIDWTFAVGDRV